MAKLSTQIKQSQPQPAIQKRPTRTERVEKKQEFERRKKVFEKRKEEAQRIKEEKFKPKEEVYYEEVPDWDKIRLSKTYFDDVYSKEAKKRKLKEWKEQGKTKKVKRTREIPFRLEEGKHTYTGIYEGLDEKLKPFFESPEEIKERRAKKREETISKIDKELKEARERRDWRLKSQERKAEKYYERRKEAEKKGNYERAKRLKMREEQEEREKDEYQDYWKEYMNRLKGYKRQVEGGKNYEFEKIKDVAEEYADYEKRQEEIKSQRKIEKKLREYEIGSLEKRGYDPFVITKKGEKGGAEEVRLSYYNPEKQDWKELERFDIGGEKVDIRGMEKLGYSKPQEQAIKFGGRKISWKTRTPIYKSKTGEIVTPYKRTGVTEKQLIKQQQDKLIREKQEELGKRYKLPFTIREKTKGQVSQGTISTDKRGVIISQEQAKKENRISNVVNYVTGKATKGFNWLDERVHFELKKTPSAMPVTLGFGKREEATIPEKISEEATKGLTGYQQDIDKWVLGEENIKDLQQEYQLKTQKEFERQYYEPIIRGEITQEKAKKEFRQSEEAKFLQKEYQEDYRELKQDVPRWSAKGLVGGLGQAGLSFGKFGLQATKTPTRALATGGAIVVTRGVLTKIPQSVVSGAMVGYGGQKFFSPTSTYSERAMGLVTAGIGATSLGARAIKSYRKPIVTRKTIASPKTTLKTSPVGENINIISKSGKIKKGVFFTRQKVSQFGVKGSRAIVYPKGRLVTSKILRRVGIKYTPKPIYKGVPYTQPKAYQKTLKRLTKYGYSPSQAKATLRYQAPRVYETYLKQGKIVLGKGGKEAVGRFEYVTKQPKLSVSKELGIKTRAGSPTKDVMNVYRKQIKIRGKDYLFQKVKTSKFSLDKFGRIKGMEYYAEQPSIIKAKQILGKGYTPSGFRTNIEGIYSGTYRGTTRIIGKPTKVRRYFGDQRITKLGDRFYQIKPRDIRTGQTTLMQRGSELRREISLRTGTTGETFSQKQLGATDDVIKQFSGKKPKIIDINRNNIQKLSNKINKLSRTSTRGGGTIPKTKTATQSQQVQAQLKTAPTPIGRTEQLKNILKTSSKAITTTAKATGTTTALITGTIAGTTTRTETKTKTDMDLKNIVKNIAKTDMKLKTKLKTGTRPKTRTLTKPATKLTPAQIEPSLRLTSLKSPKPPTIRPTPKPFARFDDKNVKKLKKKMKEKDFFELAYLPDFTSRAIGLTPKKLQKEKAEEQVKKIMTGLEIRRGVKLI